MQISRIHIERYRSIKELDFEPSSYCVLIGENNCGKSNILRAVNLVLGEYWPSERHFSEEDFYDQKTEHDIVIQVFFDEVMEEWRNRLKIEVAGFGLRCKAYKRRVGKKPAGSLSVDYVCIKEDGKEASYPAEPLEKGHQPSRWYPLPVSGKLRERAPSLIYVDVIREYNRQTPGGRWSILRRLFNEVNTEFLNDKKQITITQEDGTTVKMTHKEAFEKNIKQAYQYLRTESFIEIETLLSANAIHQMGLDEDESKVELHFESHDPTNVFKSLQLYVDEMGISSPATEVGAGLQSAIVVAIFRTYEELKKESAVFAIEEPEVFLHPQKARYFNTVLRSLSAKGNQIFLTTHSPVFVQVHDPESVAIVRRARDIGTKVHLASKIDLAEDDRKALRLLTEFDSQRNELFFAKKVLFVEGNTEKVSLPLAFAKLGIDINKENISVVECGGKTLMPLFIRVAKSFQIPFIVLVDLDIRALQDSWPQTRKANQEERNKRHERWNSNIVDVAGVDKVFFLEPNFEAELGLSGDESQKVDQAFGYFTAIKREDIPDALKKPVNALMELRL